MVDITCWQCWFFPGLFVSEHRWNPCCAPCPSMNLAAGASRLSCVSTMPNWELSRQRDQDVTGISARKSYESQVAMMVFIFVRKTNHWGFHYTNHWFSLGFYLPTVKKKCPTVKTNHFHVPNVHAKPRWLDSQTPTNCCGEDPLSINIFGKP